MPLPDVWSVSLSAGFSEMILNGRLLCRTFLMETLSELRPRARRYDHPGELHYQHNDP